MFLLCRMEGYLVLRQAQIVHYEYDGEFSELFQFKKLAMDMVGIELAPSLQIQQKLTMQ